MKQSNTPLFYQDGRTPLHIAGESGNIAVLRLLLQNGADPLVTDKSGESALHKSCRRCHYASVCELLNFVKRHHADMGQGRETGERERRQ